ncbi:MAG: calcium-binding protein [Pseudomonadota bacterium]
MTKTVFDRSSTERAVTLEDTAVTPPSIGTTAVRLGDVFDNWLFGTANADTIEGFGGDDTMYGGAGNDTFRYTNGEDARTGEYVFGGTGSDRLLLQGAGYYDMRGGQFSSIEELEFYAQTGIDKTVSFNSSDLAQGTDLASDLLVDADSTSGSNAHIRIYTDGTSNNVSLSQWTFQDWRDTGSSADSITIYGDSNINWLTGSSERDNIYGYDGNDILSGLGDEDRLYGGAGVDYLYGGDEDDILEGGTWTDHAYGGDGDDLFVVNNGEFYDNSYGGAGTDTLSHAASAYDGLNIDFEAGTLSGTGVNGTANVASIEIYRDGSGDSTITSAGTGQTLYGNGGNDTMIATTGSETMYGGSGVDTLDLSVDNWKYSFDMNSGLSVEYGSSELFRFFENVIFGSQDDSVTGTSDANRLEMGAGDDSVDAGAGNDVIFGMNDDDVIAVGSGTDTAYGGSGKDLVIVGDSNFGDNDYFNGGSGLEDRIDYSAFSWGTPSTPVVFDLLTNTASYGAFSETIVGFEELVGSQGAETIRGDNLKNKIHAQDGDDNVDGRGGDDGILGEGGSDVLFGNLGNDFIDGGLDADFVYGGSNEDRLRGGHHDDLVSGGSGNDVVKGNSGNDSLYGGSGDDKVKGNSGNDLIVDGSGADIMGGGTGADIFDLVVDADLDKIVAFEDNLDKIKLDGFSFGALTFTDHKPGKVTIEYGSDEVLLMASGNLTSADLTASDFIF